MLDSSAVPLINISSMYLIYNMGWTGACGTTMFSISCIIISANMELRWPHGCTKVLSTCYQNGNRKSVQYLCKNKLLQNPDNHFDTPCMIHTSHCHKSDKFPAYWEESLHCLAWSFRCCFKQCMRGNILLHSAQANFLVPLCTAVMWVFKLHFTENVFSQYWQLNGFSPACIILIWRLKVDVWEKLLEQNEQWKGLSPECVLWWHNMEYFVLVKKIQCWHINFFDKLSL